MVSEADKHSLESRYARLYTSNLHQFLIMSHDCLTGRADWKPLVQMMNQKASGTGLSRIPVLTTAQTDRCPAVDVSKTSLPLFVQARMRNLYRTGKKTKKRTRVSKTILNYS